MILNRIEDLRDEALEREFDRRMSQSCLELFETIEARHPNVKLHPALKTQLLHSAGIEP